MKRNLFQKVFFFAIAMLGLVLFFNDTADAEVIAAAGTAFSALRWEGGQNNMGGFKNYVLFYPAHLCSSVPQLPDGIASDTDYVEAVGAFTMSGAEEPIFIYATDETVKYSAEAVGEVDGISYEQKGEFFFPGNKKETHAFATRVKNMKGYLVLVDSDGNQQMVGAPGLEATIKPSYDGGQKRADRRGMKFEFTAPSNQTAVFLAVKLDIDPVLGTAEYPAEAANNSD